MNINYKVIATKNNDQELATNSVGIDEIVSKNSVYEGVSWNKNTKQWDVSIEYDAQKHCLGSFDNEYTATMVYDKAARKHGKPVNFPDFKEKQAVKRKTPRKLSEMNRIEHQSSEYVGVIWNKERQRWKAQIRVAGKTKNLGLFDCPIDAARKYDDVASKHGMPVNSAVLGEEKAVKRQKHQKHRKLSEINRIEYQRSKYVGVTWNKNAQRWQTSIGFGGKKTGTSYFDCPKDAAKKYDEGARQYGKPVNFPVFGEEKAVKKIASKANCLSSFKTDSVASK